MFENLIESQQNTGLRGFLNRHFGRIDTPESALRAVRSIAKAFLWYSLISGAIGVIFVGLPILADAVLFAVLAFWLLRRRSRIAACLLALFAALGLLFTTANLLFMTGRGGNVFIAAALMAAAWRAAYATFRFHGKWKTPAEQTNLPGEALL